MSWIPDGMSQEEFESAVLYYYGELSAEESRKIEKRIESDHSYAKAYSKMSGFLKALPHEESAMPDTSDWSAIQNRCKQESVKAESDKLDIKKGLRLRMVWAFAVYAAIAVIGFYWFNALSLKPSDLVIQAYGPNVIVPGGETSFRVIARLRSGGKVSKDRLEEYRKEVDRLFAEQEGKSEVPAESEGAITDSPTAPRADSDSGRSIQELPVFPSVEWNPVLEPVVKQFAAEQAGLLANVPVRIVLVSSSGRDVLYKGKTGEQGTIDEPFKVPANVGENAMLEVQAMYKGARQTISIPVIAEPNLKIVLNTDKLRYQPGQSIHIRALVTDTSNFRNASQASVVFTVEAPDGTKLFREPKTTSEWGIASADFTLADLVLLGEYKIGAQVGSQQESLQVVVDRYALPPIKIEFATDRTWYRPGDEIAGSVSASYFFGNPVNAGRVSIRLTSFDIAEVDRGTVEGALGTDGIYRFSFAAPEKMFARDQYSHQSELSAEITVTDAAGQSSKTTRTILLTKHPYIARMMPEGGAWRGGVDNYVYVSLSTANREPWSPPTVIFESPTRQNALIKIAPGLYSGVVPSSDSGSTSRVTAKTDDGEEFEFFFPNYDYSVRTPILLHTDKAVYGPGDTIKAKVLLPAAVPVVFLDAVRGKQVLLSKAAGNANGIVDFEFTATPAMRGEVELRAYAVPYDAEDSDIELRDRRTIFVFQSDKTFSASIEQSQTAYRPGEAAELKIKLADAAGKPVSGAVGLSAIDSKLLGIQDSVSGLERVYHNLLIDLLNPRIEIHNSDLATIMTGLPPAEYILAQMQGDLSDEKAEETLMHLGYAYQTVGRAVAARKALLDTAWYEIEKSTAKSEIERYDRLSHNARRNVETGFPLMILALALIIFIAAILQHTSFHPAQPSKKLWLAYRKWTFLALLPLFFYYPAAFFDGVIPVVAVSAAGILLSTFAAKIIGEQINLYRVKAMILIAVYAVAGVWLSLAARGVIQLPYDFGGLDFFLGTVLLLVPPFLCHLFASNNLEHPYTGRTTKSTVFAMRVVGISAVVMLILAIGQPNFVTTGRVASDAILDGSFAGAEPPEAFADAKAFSDEVRASAIPALQSPGAPRVRRLFPETLLWAPEVIVDESGETAYAFQMADSITTWHVTAIANDKSGNVASANTEMQVKTDFFIDLGLPPVLTRGDKISIPVIAYNYSGTRQSVTASLAAAEWFTPGGGLSKSFTLAPGEVSSVYFPITAVSAGKFELSVSATAYGGLADAIVREIIVEPDGREINLATGGRLSAGKAALSASIPLGAIPGSGRALLKIYSGAFGHVVDGLEGIFAMPHGCFEQTSSTTYPNVMALAYLKKSGQANPEVELKARTYISLGYQRLVTFESSGGGFSWFGGGPPDLLLTAYGLMEFADMSEVSYVDPALITRTKAWMLAQAQPGTGLFKASGGSDSASTGGDGELISNSYVAWALAKAGVKRGEIFNVANYVSDGAKRTEDAYALSIAINALGLLESSQDVIAHLQERLAGMAKKDGEMGVYWEGGAGAFTVSGGYTADVETTALAALALIDSEKHSEAALGALEWLVSVKRPGGAWGSTQATVAALQALVAAQDKLAYHGTGEVSVKAGGESVESFEINNDNRGVTRLIDLTSSISDSGSLDVIIEDSNPKSNLQFQLETRYNIPWSDYRETAEVKPLELDVKYDRSELTAGDSVRVEVSAAYRGAGETGMVVIDLPIPPGFDVWSPDFDELAGSGVISRWDKTARQIIVYLSGMKRDEQIVFRYRLKALFPVEAATPPARIYEYYKPESERITRPQQIVVT